MSEAARLPLMQRVGAVIASLWIGSQLTVGYLVAPLLFSTLEPGAAGNVAARLFRFETLFGCACAVILVMTARRLETQGTPAWRKVRWLVNWMLVCVAVIGVLQAFMEPMRVAALLQGTDVGHSADAARFGIMHGVSSLIYLVESLLGLVLLWRWPGRPA
jgi:hypothetical protein